MSVKRCILRFFAIILFVLGVQNVAIAAACKTSTTVYYTPYRNYYCASSTAEPEATPNTVTSCTSCYDGYSLSQEFVTKDDYECRSNSCTSQGSPDFSQCVQLASVYVYSCVSGGDSGQTSVKLTYECPGETPQTITCDTTAFSWFAGCSNGGYACADMCQNEEKELAYWKLADATALNTTVRQSATINEYLKNSDGDVHLEPIYKEKIVLNKNGGSGGDDLFYVLNPIGYQDDAGNNIFFIVPPSRNGHIFNGYYTEKTGGTQRIDANGILNPNYSVFASISTLYAQWTACSCTNGTGATECTATVSDNKCNITWSCNDGYFNSIQSATQSGGYTAICESCSTILGSEFAHSDSGRDSGNDCYRSCKPEDVTLSSAVSGKFYYEATAPSQCTATKCQANTYLSNGTCTLCGTTYPYHDADANGATYCYTDCAAKTGYTVTGRDYDGATDTCKYTACTYSVKYNANGGSGSMPNSSHTYDTAKNLTANTFTRTGYAFTGWNTKEDGSGTSYINGESVKNLTTTNSGTVNLYAQWTANTITLNFVNGGRGTAPTTPTSCTYDSTFTMPAAMTATGYTFDKWSVNNKTFSAGASVICNSANLGVTSGTATIKGTWTAKEYTVTYSCGSGTGTVPSSATATYDSNFTPVTNGSSNCKRDGYTFAGWTTTNNSGSTVSHTAGTTFKWQYTANKTFTAQWTANTITLNFANGGRGTAPTTPTSCTYDSTFTMPAAMTATGYTFDKWSVNNNTFSAGASVICNNTNLGVTSGAATIKGTWTAKITTINLDSSHNGTSVNTNATPTTIYSKYDAGYFSDSTTTTVISKLTNIPKYNKYVFKGFYDGSTQIINQEGNIVAAQNFYADTITKTINAKYEKCTCNLGQNVKSCDVTGTSNNTCEYNYTCEDGYIITDSALINGVFEGTKNNSSHTSPNCTPRCNKITLNNTANGGTGGTTAIYTKTGSGVYYSDAACTAGNEIEKSNELVKPTKTNASFNGYYDALTGDTQCTEYARGMWKNCSVNGDTTWYARYNCTQDWRGSGTTIPGECTRSIYKVNFDKNHTDATGTMEVQSVESGVATKLNANKFVRTGYTFSGWNTAADGSGDQYTDQAEINRNATHNSEFTLYAQWTTEEYAITYYDGDTKLTNLELNNYKTTWETFDLPTPTKTGYTFVNWYENPELSGEPVTKVTKGSTGDKTFWAKWTANRYSVTYACGTTDATPPSATEATYDQKFTMAENTCVRPGYTFSHWISTNNERYSAGSFYTWKFTTGKTFIAQWTAVTYTITYNPNGGSAVADNTYTVEATFELPTTTRDGYTFAGWYDNAELSGEPVTEVTKGSTGDKTFWAKWTANKITINYYINGKSVPGDYSCTYDQSFNILEYTDNELLPAGYDKITQWIDNVHQNQYTPNDLVLCNENDIGVSSGTIDLHANLQKGKYKITLDGNGGTGGTTMLYTRYEDGVYLDAERTHEMTADNNPITIPEKQYTVTYNANGGSCSQNEDIVTYIFKEYTQRTQYHPSAPVWINNTGYITEHGYSKSIASTKDIKLYAYYSANSTTLPTPTRDGYTFSGWTNAETDGVRIGGAGDSYTPTDNITLYAQWTEEEYTITYNLPESAENNSSNPSTYTVNDDVTLYDPSYYGYDFDGWYENEQQITNIPKGSTGNKILTSKWNPKLLKVFVQKSNGDIDSNKQLSNCVYGKEYSIPKNQFGQTGYEFIGWTCTGPTVCNTLGILPADGNLESLMDWAQITSGDSITLIANWEPSKYSVTYDCGDGSTGTAPSKEEAKYNELFTVAENTCERTGYTFIKWETFNDNGVKQGLLAGDQFNWEYLKDKTLTAYWEPNTIAIHYYNNNTLVHTDTCTYDETFISYLGNAPEGYQYLDGIWHLEFEGKKLFHGAAYNCDYETLGVASGEISAGEELIPNKYRIHFYANDGTNTVTYQDRTYDDNKQLNKNQFTRTGYTFISWNTQTNGKGVTYEDMQYGNITSNSDEIVALYAQWEANPITCLKGYYLPAQTVTCIICESDSYCDGGTFIIQQKSQGIKLCPYGQKSPAGSTNISQCYADAQECFIEHATMAHRHWDYDKNAYGKCIAEECEAEYHLEANACVSDKQPCSTQNGTGIKIWNSTTLQYGNCTETECKPGYTISSEQCVPCDNMYVDNEIAVSTYSNECEIATCMYQGEKYILDNNECVPICETVTDKSGSRHWDKNSKRCVHECNAGWTKW